MFGQSEDFCLQSLAEGWDDANCILKFHSSCGFLYLLNVELWLVQLAGKYYIS